MGEDLRQGAGPCDPDGATAAFYSGRAAEYAEKTLGTDLSHHWDAFAERLPPSALVLDLGCGAGRDLRALAERGFRPFGIDRSPALLRIATDHSGRPVARSDIRRIALASDSFDGVWAIASLLHVPRHEVGRALAEVHRILRPSGVFFSTMQRGDGHRVLADGRFFEFYEPDEWRGLLLGHGLEVEAYGEDVVDRTAGVGSANRITWMKSLARRI